jgi:hypothetical protein
VTLDNVWNKFAANDNSLALSPPAFYVGERVEERRS